MPSRFLRASWFALGLAAIAATPGAPAAPFTPASDAVVVERLPTATDPALRSVESLRRQLAAQPQDAELRLQLARRYFGLAMAQGDPRYVGYATAALAPLETTHADDARYWLLRGLIAQYSHDFEGAVASLTRASERDPLAVDPVAWRAAIRMVQARYNDAEQECRRLSAIAPLLLARGCSAYVQAATGQLRPAYDGLRAVLALQKDGVPPGLAVWVYTRLAEMALRLQLWHEAEAYFREALDTGETDQFLLGAYADYLIARKRAPEALALLQGWERSDVLLLRLALAGRAAKDRRAANWTQQLADRFADAARRGDRLHEQEAARFALDIQGDAARALQLAQANYERQKEPRDAEILLRAAIAAKQPDAAEPALQWLRSSSYEDPALEQLAQAVRSMR